MNVRITAIIALTVLLGLGLLKGDEPTHPVLVTNAEARVLSSSPRILTNAPLGLWVGTWKLVELTRLITNAPHLDVWIPSTLELRVYAYELDWDATISRDGDEVNAEFLWKDAGGRIRQWWDEGPPVTLHRGEFIAGSLGSSRPFTYVLIETGAGFELETVSSTLNARLRLKKISDEPPQPVFPEGLRNSDSHRKAVSSWDDEYRKWKRKNDPH